MTMTPADRPIRPQLSFVGRLRIFLEMIKFSHSIFAMPFALIGAFLASRRIGLTWPGWTRLGLVVVCMVLARTFAMTFNRLADRRLDARNPRTLRRPSVTGEISAPFMAGLLVLTGLLFIGATGLFYVLKQNIFPLLLSAPVLAWIAGYSLTKRFTWLCHFVLGISLGLAPVSAWIAIVPPHGPAVDPQILLLGIAVTFWTAGFDILYALQDMQVDRSEKLSSIPAKIGIGKSLWVSRLCHLLTIMAMTAFGSGWPGGMPLGVLFWIGLAAVVILLVVEQSLVKANDISKVNLAFMTVNGLVGLVFGTLAIAAVLLH